MKKNVVLFCIAILMMSLLFACSKSATNNIENRENQNVKTEKTGEAGSETFQFTDSVGRSVELPANIEKIVPSAGLAQMVLYTIAPEKLAGLATALSDEQKEFVNEEYWSLPVFGQFHGDNFNLEAIVSIDPDVIIDIGEAKSDIKESIDEIQEKTGIPTIFIEATLDSTPEMYKTLGKLLKEEERAAKLAAFTEEILDLAETNKGLITDKNRVSLYYGSGDKGLNTNAAGSFHLEILDYLGIENAAVLDEIASKGGGNEISMEQLMIWNPDIILLNDKNVFENVASGKEPSWQELTAVQNGQVYLVPNAPYNWIGFPPSVNRIIGMNWLGNLVYPELYAYDLKEKVKEYYSLFYHYELTDEEAKQLLDQATKGD